MGWWIGAIGFGILQFVWIVAVMAGVFRRKNKAWSAEALSGFAAHGVFAVLALWMFLVAIGWREIGGTMSMLLKSLGGLFLLAGAGWAIYVIVAVATHTEGFSTLSQIVPYLLLHAGALFSGMVLVGLGQRVNKPSRAA